MKEICNEFGCMRAIAEGYSKEEDKLVKLLKSANNKDTLKRLDFIKKVQSNYAKRIKSQGGFCSYCPDGRTLSTDEKKCSFISLSTPVY
jgi:hypothetical protein